MIKKVSLLYILWRVFSFGPIILGNFFITKRSGYDYIYFSHFLEKSIVPFGNILPLANFDGVYYLLISAGGYTSNAGFFPLFPLSISWATFAFRGFSYQSLLVVQLFAGVILASLYLYLSLIVLYKLIKIDYQRKTAFQTIFFILVFPTSFFFVAVYSESLFLLLSVLSFYFARKRSWFFASLFAGLSTATRFVGIAIIPSLIFEFVKQEKTLFKTKAVVLFLSLAGIIGYIMFNISKWGDAFYFIKAQGNFANNRSVESIVLFPQTVFRYIKIIFKVSSTHFEWWISLLELSSFIFGLIMIYICFKKNVRASYIVFALISLLMPASTGTLSGFPRYVLTIFPLFIGLALLNNRNLKIIYCIVVAILLFTLFALFSRGYYIA